MAFNKPGREIRRVFLHCSASDNPDHDDIGVIRGWHMDGNGWSDVGYHFFIRRYGTLEAGRPLGDPPAAQAGNNAATIAVCLHGLDPSSFAGAQYRTLIGLARDIDRAYDGRMSFHGHCEVSAKSCPVFPYAAVLGLDADGRMVLSPTDSPPAPETAAAPDTADGEPETLRLTAHGPAVRRLQDLLTEAGYPLTADGLFGRATLAAVISFQADNDLHRDGIVGPRSWAALTRPR